MCKLADVLAEQIQEKLVNCFLHPVNPPQITQHPTSQLNMVHGSQVTFTVTATADAGTLTYLWQRNGANLDSPPVGVSGVTTNMLTINNVQESNTGVYRCVVSNAPSSTTTSNAAQLTLRECLTLCLIQPICAKPTWKPCSHVLMCVHVQMCIKDIMNSFRMLSQNME